MTVDRETPSLSEVWALLQKQEARTAQIEVDNVELKATTQRMEAENVELKAELERQRLERVSLTSRVNEVEGGTAPQDKKLTRAGLFKAAAMGSAAVVGAGALGTLGAEHAAAATTDTNFIASGAVSNFDARGNAGYGVDTANGTFYIAGHFVGTSNGVYAAGTGTGSVGISAQGVQYAASLTSTSGVPLRLAPGSAAGSPSTGGHYVGEIYIDSAARIFHCVASGIPGTWIPLNALVPISPVRVLDTRSGITTGPYPTGTTLDVTLAGQTFTTSSGSFTFPSNTIGVVGNLVAVTPTGAGYLVAYPQGATLPTAASVNFVPPGTGSDIYYAIGNNVTVALSASGQVSIYMGLVAGANVQVVLDIAGYLV